MVYKLFITGTSGLPLCVHSCEPTFYENSVLCAMSCTLKQAEQDICTETRTIPNELVQSKKLSF